MAVYKRLRPDPRALAVELAGKALAAARSSSTARAGGAYFPGAGGTGTLVGNGPQGSGVLQWLGDTTPPGRPLGVSADGGAGMLVASWGGELEGGVPEDFAHVRVMARCGGVTSVVGDLACRGTVASAAFPGGSEVEVWAVARDAARDAGTGALSPNESGESDHVTVTVADTSSALAEEALAAAEAIGQHFWSDEAGVHVSDEAGVAEGAHNVLVNSLGILLRAAASNLVSITPSGVAVYDGSGNGEENVLAEFTGAVARIGNDVNGSRVELSGGEGVVAAFDDSGETPTTGLRLLSRARDTGVTELGLGFFSSDPMNPEIALTIDQSRGPGGLQQAVSCQRDLYVYGETRLHGPMSCEDFSLGGGYGGHHPGTTLSGVYGPFSYVGSLSGGTDLAFADYSHFRKQVGRDFMPDRDMVVAMNPDGDAANRLYYAPIYRGRQFIVRLSSGFTGGLRVNWMYFAGLVGDGEVPEY